MRVADLIRVLQGVDPDTDVAVEHPAPSTTGVRLDIHIPTREEAAERMRTERPDSATICGVLGHLFRCEKRVEARVQLVTAYIMAKKMDKRLREYRS